MSSPEHAEGKMLPAKNYVSQNLLFCHYIEAVCPQMVNYFVSEIGNTC